MKNEWSKHTRDGGAYVGSERKQQLIYVGGPHYESSAQVHLTVTQAKEVRKLLGVAIKRCSGVKCRTRASRAGGSNEK